MRSLGKINMECLELEAMLTGLSTTELMLDVASYVKALLIYGPCFKECFLCSVSLVAYPNSAILMAMKH